MSISSGVDRLFGRIGFSQQIQNFKISINQILDSCKADLNTYEKLYTKYWIYHGNGTRLQMYKDVH